MSSVENVKAALRVGNQAAGEGTKLLAQVAAETAEVAALARQVLDDSRAEEVTASLSTLSEAIHEIELTQRRFTAAVAHAGTYLDRL